MNETRNLCSECKECEGKNEYSLKDCIELCVYPTEILQILEAERNKGDTTNAN